MKQEVARLHKPKPGEKEKESWSLDDVVYKNVVREANYDTSRDSEGVFIRGMYLHGGRWNKNVLDEPIGTEMFFDLPLLYWTAETKKKAMEHEKANEYQPPQPLLSCRRTGPGHFVSIQRPSQRIVK